ncbi:MAG: hypothetical protein RL660_1502 [Bacteroidota bacterium]
MVMALSAFLAAMPSTCIAQIFGCTDIMATNFNPAATQNDGSCLYAPVSRNASLIKTLDASLNENSALTLIADTLLTINDGGGATSILAIDTSLGTIIRSHKLRTASNIDWEAMCATASYLYVADVGNNDGSRTNLCIYKVYRDSLSSDSSIALRTNFSYEDQTDFSSNSQTKFDCEAVIAIHDTIHLFTKQWGNHWCTHYKLRSDLANDTARIADSFYVRGLITDASLRADGQIVLLGYDTNAQAFIWHLWDYQGDQFFSGNKRRIDLGFSVGQAEGIAWQQDSTLLISSERISIFPPNIYRLDTRDIMNWPLKTNTEFTRSLYLANQFIYGNDVKFIKQVNLLSSSGAICYNWPSTKAIPPQHFVIVYMQNGERVVLKNF